MVLIVQCSTVQQCSRVEIGWRPVPFGTYSMALSALSFPLTLNAVHTPSQASNPIQQLYVPYQYTVQLLTALECYKVE